MFVVTVGTYKVKICMLILQLILFRRINILTFVDF